jgi:hypothetical protein
MRTIREGRENCATPKRDTVATELNVLALVKGSERYVFIYDDASQAALMEVLQEQAADPRLALTWFDASVLTQKAREQAQAHDTAPAADRIREVP